MQLFLADIILPDFYITAGATAFLPTLAFTIFAEAYILSRFLHKPYKMMVNLSLRANLASMILGSALFWLMPISPSKIAYPSSLSSYAAHFWIYAIAAYLAYYLFSVILEWLFAIFWKKKHMQSVKNFSFFQAFILANIISYTVLIPLHYYHARPLNNISEITNTTDWAIQPPAIVIYQDIEKHHLWRVNTDGTDNHLLVPYPMKQYLISYDLTQILFFDDGKKLFHYDANTKTLTTLWESQYGGSSKFGRLENVMQIAMSPGGKQAAWIIPMREGAGKYGPWETDFWKLFIYNHNNGLTLTYDYKAHGSKIAWSSNENVLFINCPAIAYKESVGGIGGLAAFSISDNGSQVVLRENVNPSQVYFANHYGRLGSVYYSGGKVGVERVSDIYGSMKATAPIWSKEITITNDKQVLFSFSDVPFFAPFSRRSISEPAFIQQGRECLIEARESIYLIDIANRKIGALVKGENYIVISDTFHKNRFFFEK